MGVLINKADFVGTFALSKSISDTIVPFITRHEARYLRQLLGVELYILFKADLTPLQVPTTGIYLTIYNELYLDEDYHPIQSEGMKTMLLGFIWWEYVKATKYKATDTGVVVNSQEVSRGAGWDEGFIYGKYNDSVKTYQNIQEYILRVDPNAYPTFKGVQKLLSGNLI